jgi:ATP-binding cassette, subfamily B, bacterial
MAKSSSLVGAIRKFNRILFINNKEVSAIYIYAILAGAVQLSLPLGIQSIIGFVMAGTLSTSIVVLITMVLFGVFINGLLQVRQLQIIEKIKQQLFFRYAMEYANKLPILDLEKLDNEYLPEKVNRFLESVSLQKGIDKLLLDLPSAIVQILFGMILLSFYHIVFLACGLFFILIIVLLLVITSPGAWRTAISASSYKYELVAWLQEIARIVKSFKFTKQTDLHVQNTDALLSEYLHAKTKHFKILMVQSWGLIWFKIIVTACLLIIGSYLLINQEINVGQFIASDIVIIAIMSSVEKLISNLDTVYDALVSVEKLNMITESAIEVSGDIVMPNTNEGLAIQFENVSYAYEPNQYVLHNFNASIQAGQIVWLHGPSGAGKTTIMRLLTGSFNNYEGSIILNNVPLHNYDLASFRKQTGIHLSINDIFAGSILQNITMGHDEITIEQVTELSIVLGLDKFIKQSKNGYQTMLMPLGAKLSNEVRTNILLMRALLGKHRLLLLEDPFCHLSDTVTLKLQQWMKKNIYGTVLIASETEDKKSFAQIHFHLNNIAQ